MKTKILAVVLLLAVLSMSGSACGGGGPEMSAEEIEIKDEAIVAGAELDTYQLDGDMTMNMWMTIEGEIFVASMAVDMEGAVDKSNEEMYVDMDIVMKMTGEEDIEMSMGTYMVDDWIYVGMDMFGTDMMWWKTHMEAGDWYEHDIVTQQLDILSDVEVELVGTDTVDGTECYVLDVMPDIEELWSMMEFMGAEEGLPPELNLEDVITDYAVRQWVAKDTYITLKTTENLKMVFTPESFGIPPELVGEFDVTADMAIVITLHHINEPVTIELPLEAEDSVEVFSFD